MGCKLIFVGSAAVFAFLFEGSSSVAAAELKPSGPYQLDNSELDRVTAGVQVNATAAAHITGAGFGLTEVNAAGTTSQTSLPRGSGFIASGAGIGTAAALGPGGTSSASAATSGSLPPGTVLASGSINGTATFPSGQVSVSATYVSGGTTFLP
jgi:hypothetical protein